jgi:squalene-associated FAD-dependent desaturase
MSGGTIHRGLPMSPDVLVIGGGVAGLCAAVECASLGHSVILAEQHQHLGGRVYSFTDGETGDDVDNGQHLMLGCYASTLRYLRTVGTIEKLSIQPTLEISFRSQSRSYRLHAPGLPAPLHALSALLGLETLSWKDRVSILRIVPTLLTAVTATDTLLRSITVDDWLTRCGQSAASKKHLWNILSIGTLNERPEKACAAVFVKVLQTVFLGSRSDASIALPRAGLSRLFGDGGAAYITSRGGGVMLGTRAADIAVADGCVESLTIGGRRIEPRVVISAVPHHAFGDLFPDGNSAALPMIAQSAHFEPVPIVSIHLWYDRHFMDEEFTALLDSPIDWIFNKTRTAGKDTTGLMYLSLVISAAREQSALTKAEITAMADEEVRRHYPAAAHAVLRHSLVIKEKRATFSPSGKYEELRPLHATPVRNLFIAGDWSATSLPATIEGAAQSGYACAALADEHLRGML